MESRTIRSLVEIVFLFGLSLVMFGQGNGFLAQKSPFTANLNDAFFVDYQIGSVVGDSGAVAVTRNGGAVWTVRELPARFVSANVKVRACVMPIDNVLIVGGEFVGNAFLLRSENRGETWTEIDLEKLGSASGVAVNKIVFSTPMVGFAQFNKRFILKTTNGGISWSEAINISQTFYGFDCDKEGSIAFTQTFRGSDPNLTRSTLQIMTASGEVHQFVYPTEENRQTVFEVVSLGNGKWRVASLRGNHTTADNGKTWDTVSGNPYHRFFKYGECGLYRYQPLAKSTDCGESWIPQQVPADAPYLTKIVGLTHNIAFAIGHKGSIFKTMDGGLVGISSDQTGELSISPTEVSRGEITLRGLTERAEIKVCDNIGRVCHSFTLLENSSQEQPIDASELPSGTYFLHVKSNRRSVALPFLVKR